ncbi:MAG: hypothetical protein WDW36_007428 [Sanguina aurantia]
MPDLPAHPDIFSDSCPPHPFTRRRRPALSHGTDRRRPLPQHPTILSLSAVFFHPASDFAHTLLLLTALLTSVYTCKLWLRCFAQLGGRAHTAPNVTHFHHATPASTHSPASFTASSARSLVAKVWIGTNLLSSASGLVLFVAWGVKSTAPAARQL